MRLNFLIVFLCAAAPFSVYGQYSATSNNGTSNTGTSNGAGGSGTLPNNFQSKTYQEKVDILWDRISMTKHSWYNLPADNYSIPDFISHFSDFQNNLLPIFTDKGDEYTVPHLKVICMHGTASKVIMHINANSPYTGLFGPNQDILGISRLALLGYSPPPKYEGGFAPFASYKWPISGNVSQGMVAGYDVIGHYPNKNWFNRYISNELAFPASGILPFPRNVTIAGFLGAVGLLPPPPNRPETMPLSIALWELCGIYQNGSLVQGHVVAPYSIRFMPNHAFDINQDSQQDFRLDLHQTIPANSIIYTIAAQNFNTSTFEEIGYIKTLTEQISSEYSDKSFRIHHPIERWIP